MNQHDMAMRQFGSKAAQYLMSTVHAGGLDLDRLTDLSTRTPPGRALDVGCGAGHASFALARGGAAQVVAYDPSQPMLDIVAGEAARRRHTQIETISGPAEVLPFRDASFDIVVTRYSAHHWRDLGTAVREISRVLKSGGAAVIIDVMAPEKPLLDTHLQTIEVLRDPSHVRNYRESEWRQMLAAADLRISNTLRWRLPLEFDAWVARSGTSLERIDALKMLFDELPQEAREHFAITPQRSFTIDAGWLEARLGV